MTKQREPRGQGARDKVDEQALLQCDKPRHFITTNPLSTTNIMKFDEKWGSSIGLPQNDGTPPCRGIPDLPEINGVQEFQIIVQ